HTPPIDCIDRQLIREGLGHLIAQGQSAKSIARFIPTIRSVHRVAIREKSASTDPTVLFDSPKYDNILPDVLHVAEVLALLV
ncbi:site-specific integrase, partial [Staphylococcus aureus]